MRLLGAYDNVWLSHADRAHIVPDDVRPGGWAANAGVGSTVFVDGFMAGLWWWRDDHLDLDLFRRLSRAQRADLDTEVDRVESLLAFPLRAPDSAAAQTRRIVARRRSLSPGASLRG